MVVYVLLTDGSIEDPHKPSYGGYGYQLCKYDGKDLVKLYEGGGGESNTTNNRMEMSAIRDGLLLSLEHFVNFGYEKEDRLVVISDSDLCVLSLNKFIYSWLRRIRDGVMYKSDNRPVENQDLVKKAYEYKTQLEKLISLHIYHINSHIPKNKQSRQTYMEKFMKKNNCLMSIELFNKIADQNDEIDRLAKKFMRQKENNKQ